MRSLGVAVALLLALTTLSRTQDAVAVPSRIRTVAIDPGHGGDDVGTRGAGGLQEKTLALDVGLRLRTRLETQLELRVVMTRQDDRALLPDERAAIANAAGADLLLSLHANAAPSASVAGAEVYYRALDQPQPGLLPSLAPVPSLLPWHEAQARQYDASGRLAALVHEELQRNVPMHQPVRQAPLRVLQGATMPAVAIELVFLTNPGQEEAAAAPALRDTLATALTAATARFQSWLDSGNAQ